MLSESKFGLSQSKFGLSQSKFGLSVQISAITFLREKTPGLCSLLISREYVIFTQWRQIVLNFCFEFFSISFIILAWLRLPTKLKRIQKENWEEFGIIGWKLRCVNVLSKNIFWFCNVSGDAGDSLGYHNGMKFSTKDKDNDSDPGYSCAQHFKGAWWYNGYQRSNLNGLYLRGEHNNFSSVSWHGWRGEYFSLQKTEMKIRPSKS